jgi:hypothetical protein
MALDPKRYPFARLVDASHRLPWGGRLFGDNQDHPGLERVDLWDSHVSMLIAGGSLVLADPPAPTPSPVSTREGGA